MKVAEQTYYLNADKTEAIPAKSPKKSDGEDFDETPEGAAYLLVRKGQEVADEMIDTYGVKAVEQKEAEESATEDAGETEDATASKKSAKKSTK